MALLPDYKDERPRQRASAKLKKSDSAGPMNGKVEAEAAPSVRKPIASA